MTRALVVIDVQEGMFTVPGFTPHEGEAVVRRIANLIAEARQTGLPVVYVQHAGGAGHPLSPDGPGFPIRSELAPQAGERVVVKHNINAFQDTDLDAHLKSSGITRLVVCGMQSQFCVDTATRAAFERGYTVTLVSDAHTTFDTTQLKAADIVAHHNATLGGRFAELKTSGEALAQ
jgi:nicotinamidase-related amidase